MARQRFVKPGFFKHRELFDAEKASGLPLRLVYEGLWCQADCRGIFRWKATELKLDILPYDDVDFEAALMALADGKFIVRYVVAGKVYGFIPTFKDHQTFHHKEKPSADPGPPPDKPRARPVQVRPKPGVSPTVAVAVAVAVTDAVAVPGPTQPRVHLHADREYASSNGTPPVSLVEPSPDELAEHERLRAEAKAKLAAHRETAST